MGDLIYSAITSLDGYVADSGGKFDWALPDEEVHTFINDLERSVATFLYGRRMYEVMVFWESEEATTDQPLYIKNFGEIWRTAEKIVYSRVLDSVASERTRIERRFDPGVVARLKANKQRDLSVGGPGLAAHALAAGLVDEVRLFVAPISVGGGTRFLPENSRVELTLLDERRFANGTVYLRYGTEGP